MVLQIECVENKYIAIKIDEPISIVKLFLGLCNERY